MIDKDNPFSFGGGADRTVIRPNPGNRLSPSQPPPSTAPPPAGAPQSTPPAGPYARPAPFSRAGGLDSEEWISSSRAADPNVAMQRAEDLHFEELAARHENPIMRAAGPLLLLLGRLRVAMVRASFASLMEQVAAAVNFFDRDIRLAGVPPEQANVAKYLICATADDIVQNIPTEDRHVWTQYSMLSRFFGERIGGVRFFEELDRLKREPAVNYNVLELQHACLALGFQGQYRASTGGVGQLQLIQRDLYETLRRVRPKVALDLSPHWKGQALGARNSRLQVPVWAVGGIAALALFALFLTLRAVLGEASERVAEANIALHSNSKVTLQRRLPSPPPAIPPTGQLQRIRAGLEPGIPGCAIRVCSGIMFQSGQATVLPQFRPVARRIAQIIEKEPGPVVIRGHTDNQPLAPTNRFKNNQQLSLERARETAALIAPGLSQPNRVATEGRGPDEPIADNKSPDGRARNRRVEFLITRAD
jgi:type VI secretion system protein ImpK